MAVTLTPRLGLKKWSVGDDPWGGRTTFNDQNDLLEDLVAIDAQGLIGDRPAAGVRGTYYYATDQGLLYRDNGAGWVAIGTDATKLAGLVPVGSVPNLPASRVTSGVFDLARIPSIDEPRVPALPASKVTSGVFDLARIPAIDAARVPNLDAAKTTTGVFDEARIPRLQPLGIPEEFLGDPGALPAGWLACDGSLVSRAAYPQLFAAIGTRYGVGDGVTTFKLPTLFGRYVGGDVSSTTLADFATMSATWDVDDASIVVTQGMARIRVRCHRTSTLAVTNDTGNVVDSAIFTLKTPYRPAGEEAFTTGDAIRVGTGYIGTDGVTRLTAVGGSATINTSEHFTISAMFRLANTAANRSTMIIRAV